jgi:hypothetical protein
MAFSASLREWAFLKLGVIARVIIRHAPVFFAGLIRFGTWRRL